MTTAERSTAIEPARGGPHGVPRSRGASVAPRRRSSIAARGEPLLWLLGFAQLSCVAMIAGLVLLAVVQGLGTFWPRPIDRVTLKDGSVLLGVLVRSEPITAGDSSGSRGAAPQRHLFRVGNRDLGQEPFRWVDEDSIASVERPRDAVLVERQEWGVWIGVVKDVIHAGAGANRRAEAGSELAAALDRAVAEGADRQAEINRITRVELGRVNDLIEGERLAERRAALGVSRPGMGWARWLVCAAIACALAVTGVRAGRIAPGSLVGAWRTLAFGLAGGVALYCAVEHPRAARADEPSRVTASAERLTALRARYDALLERTHSLRMEDQRHRVVLVDVPGGRIASARKDEPDSPLLASQIVRVVPGNALSWWGKLGVYVSRWGEYVFDEPREANTEGGVFPVIVGTVLLTVLLSVIVVPLGVIAALYLREYARQGPMVSLIRIAVNNLAGVPSIVYGVFGLGFFCYTLGAFVDGGPANAGLGTSWPRWVWWGGVGAVIGVATCATALVGLARGSIQQGLMRPGYRVAAWAGWIIALVGAVALVAKTPYFSGLFAEKLPAPTFGGRGILWAALTLALLTLPVVIVATEEALASVPRTIREGSYGCGASRWQTIRRVVLPQAMPGIMTGGILAMSRGAGEVAPLMLVGAVKLAPELPFSRTFPWIHPERSFMHLGFHIYDLGFQSPDSEAARPLVWTTTLLLMTLVVVLNLAAITARARLRARVRGSVV